MSIIRGRRRASLPSDKALRSPTTSVALLAGAPLVPFRPQTKFLSLISTGDRSAVASRGGWAAQGAALWHLKDWIDRRWMRQYQLLPATDSSNPPPLSEAEDDVRAH